MVVHFSLNGDSDVVRSIQFGLCKCIAFNIAPHVPPASPPCVVRGAWSLRTACDATIHSFLSFRCRQSIRVTIVSPSRRHPIRTQTRKTFMWCCRRAFTTFSAQYLPSCHYRASHCSCTSARSRISLANNSVAPKMYDWCWTYWFRCVLVINLLSFAINISKW